MTEEKLPQGYKSPDPSPGSKEDIALHGPREERIPRRIEERPISKQNVISMLKNYDADRKSISQIVEQLATEAEDILWPSIPGPDSPRVQYTVDISTTIDLMLSKCDESRRYYRRTLERLKKANDTLDRLMLCMVELPAHLRLSIIETYLNGRKIGDVARSLDKSIRTVTDYNQQAVDTIWEKINA